MDRVGSRCISCNEKFIEYQRQYRDFCRKLKICPCCKKEKLFGSEKQCITCRQKNYDRKKPLAEEKRIEYNENFKKNQRELYKYRKENGICTRCGKHNAEPGKAKCRTCLDKDAYIHRKARFDEINIVEYRKENGLCYYCGNPIEDKTVKACLSCRKKMSEYRSRANINTNYLKMDNKIVFGRKE